MTNSVPRKRARQSEERSFVEFQHNWEFDIQPFNTYKFNGQFRSDPVRMVHGCIGFEWELHVYPGGTKVGEKEWRTHMGVFLRYKDGLHQKLEGVKYMVFVDGRNASEDVFTWWQYSFERVGTGFGKTKFLLIGGENAFETLREQGYIQEKMGDAGKYVIKLAARVRIPEEYFDWKKVMEEKKAEVAPKASFNVTDLLDEVSVDLAPGTRPPSDVSNVLDFKIGTTDGFVFWCHKNVLSRKNRHFRDVMSSGTYPEATENRVDVSYDQEMMMLILYFIYTDKVSKKFPDEIGKVMEIVKAVHFFEVKGLSLHCEEKLIENLLGEKCMDLSVEMFCFADRYGLEILREISLNLASDNIGKIITSGIYTNLSSEVWKEIACQLRKALKGRVPPRGQVRSSGQVPPTGLWRSIISDILLKHGFVVW